MVPHNTKKIESLAIGGWRAQGGSSKERNHEKLVPKHGSDCSTGNRWNWVCHQEVRQRIGRPGKQASGRVGQEDRGECSSHRAARRQDLEGNLSGRREGELG